MSGKVHVDKSTANIDERLSPSQARDVLATSSSTSQMANVIEDYETSQIFKDVIGAHKLQWT
jgi:hypothetical protein